MSKRRQVPAGILFYARLYRPDDFYCKNDLPDKMFLSKNLFDADRKELEEKNIFKGGIVFILFIYLFYTVGKDFKVKLRF